ncbi:MAG: UbiX family flavin prenyltransferase [Planctomycetes bacterium]|nr:UbiX family flavin prenyltransferase [Planctomycetota bacterium]
MTDKKIIVGVSGASGVIYAHRLLDLLERSGCEVHVVVTDPARQIFIEEMSITELTAGGLLGRESQNLVFHDNQNLFSHLASGSIEADGMVVCPCSSHTLSAIAGGLADTLLLRSAYVSLKQRRRLILVHRETPLTEIDLKNMLQISQTGGIICPANPAFYLAPQTISDMVDFLVGRVLDLLGIDHELDTRWTP